MRVLHAIRSDGFAGVERHVARLARAQAARGDRVVVVGGAPAPMRATFGGVDVRHRPAASTADVTRELLAAAPGADVVHVHMTAAEVGATLAGAGRLVTTRHFAAPRGSGRLGAAKAAVARSRVAAQIAISAYVAEHVDGPSTIVYPGVESRPDAARAARRDRTVLMVQRLEPEKGTDTELRAFAASGLAADGWRLEVAGGGSQWSTLTDLARGLGIADAVRFLGARDDVGTLMARAGMFLAPCPVEGLGLSVLEAMSAGLPVIASDAGGHVETIGEADRDVLFQADDFIAAGRLLASLAGDEDARDRVASASVDLQRARFTPEAQAEATARVYAGVLS